MEKKNNNTDSDQQDTLQKPLLESKRQVIHHFVCITKGPFGW